MPYDAQKHGPKRVVGPGFHERVFAVVRTIPPGHVTTYGDVAAALGRKSVARHVGYALAAIPAELDDVPWFRVINSQGRISFPADSEQGRRQESRLLEEGVPVENGRVVGFRALRWVPDRLA